jgi:hypothetical protein
LGTTAKPYGSKDLLDAFESTFGGTLGRLLTARGAKRETKLVRLIHAQEGTLFPAPGKGIDAAGTHSCGYA